MLSPSMKAMPMGRRSIWSRTARWSALPVPESPKKARRASRSCPRTPTASSERTRMAAAAAPPRRLMPASVRGGLAQGRQLVVEVDGGGDALLEVAQVQALVLGVGVAGRILDPGQEAGRPTQEVGERLHEPDGAA